MTNGSVEYPQNDAIIGWAFACEGDDDHLLIEAFLGDRLIGTATADGPWADPQPKADGHGFRIALRQPLTEEAISDLAVYATALSGERSLLPMASAAKNETCRESSAKRPARGAPRTDVDESQSPIFVLGAPRSGTTAITQALLGLPQFDGVEEDHLLTLVSPLIETVDEHFAKLDRDRRHSLRPEEIATLDTLDRRITAADITASIRSIFIEAIHNTFHGNRWVLKTPNAVMVRAAPLMREMWPQSRFIFMKRRGIENIVSRTKKFSTERFRDHCTAWTDAMWSWVGVRAQLAGAAIEVDQLLVAREPRRAAAALGAFLALGDSDIAHLEQAFSRDRPEQTSDAFGTVYDPEELPWSSEEFNVFERTCGQMMEEFGYDFGRKYYREGEQDHNLLLL